MNQAMTVDEVISKLQEISDSGNGGSILIVAPSQAQVTGVYGNVPISNADHDAVLLYAKPR